MDKKGEFGFKELITALIVIVVLVFVIMFLTNIDDLKEAILKITSLG